MKQLDTAGVSRHFLTAFGPIQALIVVDRSCINTINQWGSFNETDLKDQSVTGVQCVARFSLRPHTKTVSKGDAHGVRIDVMLQISGN